MPLTVPKECDVLGFLDTLINFLFTIMGTKRPLNYCAIDKDIFELNIKNLFILDHVYAVFTKFITITTSLYYGSKF